MSRWRPPLARSSPYITAEGYKALEQESKDLWAQRSEVTIALAAAAAEGDRSENAEYQYRKKQLRELDRRITYLQKRMPTLKIITEVSEPGRVYFGAEVLLETEHGEQVKYRIVGADEFDTKPHFISIDAPLARAMLGKKAGDDFEMNSMDSNQTFHILDIEYPDV